MGVKMNFWHVFLAVSVVVAVARANAQEPIGVAPVALTPTSKCANLNDEIRAMREAERTMLRQMASNNQSFAMTLDNYADEFSQLSKSSRSLSVAHLTSLRKSAQSYRGHEQRELKLVDRFENASDNLFSRVEACLKE